jgi:two-component system osmolarity sensor histidine kinase EnvZ
MLRRYAPKSLYLRVLLIVILPIFVTQSFVTYIFFARHWDKVSANLSTNVAGQIALITRYYSENRDESARAELAEWALDDLDIQVRFEPGSEIPSGDLLSPFNVYNVVLNNRLKSRIDWPYRFDTQSWRNYVEVRIQLDDGELVFLVLRQRAFATTGPIFLFWLIGTSFLLGWIATVFMRNQVKSILRLANAAEAFGRGRDAPDFRPSGATEVRKAGYAFIAMRERIKRHLDQRASMLAGVSHDLRTPLTRIKLGLAMEQDTPEIEALRNDVLEMERMVEAYLDFARNEAADEDPEPFNLAAMLSEVVNNAKRTGGKVSLDAPQNLDLSARRSALKRAVGNLVNNALRHGNEAWITVKRGEQRVTIIVEDDGPGIASEKYDDVFKPFTRLDEARSLNETGVGMGLTIVRDVARSHGGDVTLSRSPKGGLGAHIELPI